MFKLIIYVFVISFFTACSKAESVEIAELNDISLKNDQVKSKLEMIWKIKEVCGDPLKASIGCGSWDANVGLGAKDLFDIKFENFNLRDVLKKSKWSAE